MSDVYGPVSGPVNGPVNGTKTDCAKRILAIASAWSKLSLAARSLFAATSLSLVTACGPGASGLQSSADAAKIILPDQPTQDLVQLLPTFATLPAQEKIDNIYDISTARFGARLDRKEMSATVVIKTSFGFSETIDMLGKIRDDFTASLLDIQPTADGKFRMTAEGYCSDHPLCEKIILNNTIKVGKFRVDRQFVSKELAPPTLLLKPALDSHEPPHQPSRDPSPSRPATAVNPNSTPQPPTQPTRTSIPPAVPHHVAPQVGLNEENTQAADNDDFTGVGQEGQYVGAQPNPTVIEKLLERPEDPAQLIHLEASNEVVAPPVRSASSNAGLPAAPSLPASPLQDVLGRPPELPEKDPGHAVELNSTTRHWWSWIPFLIERATPKESAEKSTAAQSPAPSLPSAAAQSTSVSRATSSGPVPMPTNRPPSPVVAEAQEVLKTDPSADSSSGSLTISPFLQLNEGGFAEGFYTHGTLHSGSSIDANRSTIHVVHPELRTHFGTGLLISLIEHCADMMTKWYPELTIAIGDIALEHGGRIGHKSHENGLDIDIPYIGSNRFDTVLLSNGRLKTDFDYPKTWQFWRLLESQKIEVNGRRVTVLNRIFVGPSLKRGFCSWAKANNILSQPADVDIMRRLDPDRQHYNHFHVRLRCSPYYRDCQDQRDPPANGTGCP